LDLRGDKRRIIFSWAQREYRNLLKAREVIRVPTPLTFKDNIIVSEFIGEGEIRAPMLKDAHLEEPQVVFDEIISMMTKLFKAGMVHGDLSQFNILFHHEKCFFIDFSQSSTIESPLAKEMLHRDIGNICTYFKRFDIEGDPQELFTQITAKDA